MSISADAARTFVLKLEVVRWAIGELASHRIHPFFLAYLHLRAKSIEQGRIRDIRPQWNELAPYLEVPGGPPKKPYYRPMWHHDVQGGARYWLNENLAGSFAPSSLRQVPEKVINKSGSAFALKRGHAALALEHLLYGKPAPALAFAAFWFRNHGFQVTGAINTNGLIDALKDHFQFNNDLLVLGLQGSSHDFDTLFETSVPPDLTTPFREWSNGTARS